MLIFASISSCICIICGQTPASRNYDAHFPTRDRTLTEFRTHFVELCWIRDAQRHQHFDHAILVVLFEAVSPLLALRVPFGSKIALVGLGTDEVVSARPAVVPEFSPRALRLRLHGRGTKDRCLPAPSSNRKPLHFHRRSFDPLSSRSNASQKLRNTLSPLCRPKFRIDHMCFLHSCSDFHMFHS